MVGVAEAARRLAGRWTHRLSSLPILALNVHTACNCRCVMCDIWKANASRREIGPDELERHVEGIRGLGVQRVMLTGGEPLLHRNLWQLCARLRQENVRVTLVTSGLLVARHAGAIAEHVDALVVSIDGDPNTHDRIRGVAHAFARLEEGLRLLRGYARRPVTTARSVVQRANYGRLVETIQSVRALEVDRLSFLAADVSSTAFNRPEPWSAARRADVALPADELPALAASIRDAEARCRREIADGFVIGGAASLWRIHRYYAALLGLCEFPPVRCNAPWVSAVLEPGGVLRPCFFHAPYPTHAEAAFDRALNAPDALEFRRALRPARDDTCRRCVCSLRLPLLADP
jgi:MoaA/NifB/PqqE/SkfB family radical SAM enzyme